MNVTPKPLPVIRRNPELGICAVCETCERTVYTAHGQFTDQEKADVAAEALAKIVAHHSTCRQSRIAIEIDGPYHTLNLTLNQLTDRSAAL